MVDSGNKSGANASISYLIFSSYFILNMIAISVYPVVRYMGFKNNSPALIASPVILI